MLAQSAVSIVHNVGENSMFTLELRKPWLSPVVGFFLISGGLKHSLFSNKQGFINLHWLSSNFSLKHDSWVPLLSYFQWYVHNKKYSYKKSIATWLELLWHCCRRHTSLVKELLWLPNFIMQTWLTVFLSVDILESVEPLMRLEVAVLRISFEF